MDRETSEAGVVNALNDAITALFAYYEKYPLRWDRLNNSFWKSTLFVNLRVEQDQQGGWLLAEGTNILCVDDLLVRRNLPAAIRNLREALG